MREQPNITPISALDRLRADPKGFVIDGWRYWLDDMTTFAMKRDDEVTFFVWGDEDDPIDETSKWGWTDGVNYGEPE